MADLQEIFEKLANSSKPPHSDNPFRLASRTESGADNEEIETAWPNVVLPVEVHSLWSVSREAWLFEDIDFGQWGLHLLSPGGSALRTAIEQRDRPTDIRLDDIILGEFLGDSELLLYAPSEVENRRLLIVLPLDDREDWYAAGPSVGDVIQRYAETGGEKYWEQGTAR